MATAGTATPHLANVLGALALAVADRMIDVVSSEAGHSETAAAALSALHQFLDGPTVDRLSQVVGLTQSGAVRLVDRLELAGCVRRDQGADRRSSKVVLTAAGHRAAARIEAARLAALEEALAPLSARERRTLADLLDRVLVGLMRGPGATRWMCRLCDLDACGRMVGHCPVEREAAARYG